MRHMVRKYQDKPIPDDIVEKLNARIEEINKKHGLYMKLMVNEPHGIWTIMRLFSRGVNNYLLLAGPTIARVSVSLGYAGADIMLYAQTLGLNSWWVGGTYNRRMCESLSHGRITGIIALGYGVDQGVPHKSKTASEVSHYHGGPAPDWFKEGVEAALYAPTAMNKQKFFIEGTGDKVSISCKNGKWSETDLGIIKYHFEVGAGKENFSWE